MRSKCLQCKNQKERIVTKNIESHSSIRILYETYSCFLLENRMNYRMKITAWTEWEGKRNTSYICKPLLMANIL